MTPAVAFQATLSGMPPATPGLINCEIRDARTGQGWKGAEERGTAATSGKAVTQAAARVPRLWHFHSGRGSSAGTGTRSMAVGGWAGTDCQRTLENLWEREQPRPDGGTGVCRPDSPDRTLNGGSLLSADYSSVCLAPRDRRTLRRLTNELQCTGLDWSLHFKKTIKKPSPNNDQSGSWLGIR